MSHTLKRRLPSAPPSADATALPDAPAQERPPDRDTAQPAAAADLTFKVAHVRSQGVDMVIVPLSETFGRRPRAEQHAAIATLQSSATTARLKGSVVVMWPDRGQHRFIAPHALQAACMKLSWRAVIRNLNKVLAHG